MHADNKNIKEVVGGIDKMFVIPPFQRNYDWSIEQCEELFFDIEKALITKKNHYLGNIVYYKGENDSAGFGEYILVDGQQRVTSILLLLCAIRDLSSDNDLKESINRGYLKNNYQGKYRVRLKQTKADEDAFNNLVNESYEDANKSSNIYKNYNHFIKLLKSENIDLNEMFETIPRLEVVDVDLQITNELEAVQTVFEKINSTGKPLEASDLIRNYLLLASSSKEQELLYNDYWSKIEKTVMSENVSHFAKHYLILNILEEVMDKNVYKEFKKYFSDGKISRSSILKEMKEYSKYYKWVKFFDSDNNKINHVLELLNELKIEDLYPLMIFLFSKLYKEKQDDLLNILKLLLHFMLRYRIVKPYQGGGALRSAIYDYINVAKQDASFLSYDKVLHHLSNSKSPAGRFPSDDEFMVALEDSVQIPYARVLLLIIEESETKNTAVSVKDTTIEHLMPQELSNWWENYLAETKEEALSIQENYLNCIGNLTPMSGPGNSQNGNKKWPVKIDLLKKVSYAITHEIPEKYPEWKEKDIIKRNKNISKRAVKATISPLPRKKQYVILSKNNEFVPGLYPISDTITPMEGTTATQLIISDKVYDVTSWRDCWRRLNNILHDRDNKLMKKIAKNGDLHKSTSTKVKGKKDPVITENPELLVEPLKIGRSNIFAEGCLSSHAIREYAKQLVDLFGVTNKVQIDVQAKD